MKLSPAQITTLKKLISYKGYPEIDVQYEILDHVACEVEQLMEENPLLSLPDAFRKVHASFGIFGFSDLEESYKKAIEKRIRKNYFAHLKSLISSYRVLFPLLLAAIIYLATIFLNDPRSWVLFLAGFLILGSTFIVIKYWKSHKNYKKYASYIGTTGIFQVMNLGMICSFYSYTFVYRAEGQPDSFFTYLFQGAIVLVLVWYAVSIFILPRLLDQSIFETEKLKKLYESVDE